MDTEDGAATPQVVLGRVLRSLREARGLTQEQLALASGYSGYYIRLLEGGRKNVTVLALFRLARILDTLPSEILRQTEARTPAIPPRNPAAGDTT
jgi:transcriptional regulator with XRE-family HTH domain